MTFLNKFREDKKKGNEKDNIVEHLTDLLNTKKRFGSFLNDFGLDSYIYAGADPKAVILIAKDIKRSFEKYEKRIKDVEVSHIPNEKRFFLSFVIKCKIENNVHSFHLSLNQQNKFYHLEVEA